MSPTVAAGLAAERAPGRFDAFTDRMFGAGDHLDTMKHNGAVILSGEATMLRLRR